MVTALAAPLPLIVATPSEPSTADCGRACGERVAICDDPFEDQIDAAEGAQHAQHQEERADQRQRALGKLENTPVTISTLIALTTRVQLRPGWLNMPGTSQP